MKKAKHPLTLVGTRFTVPKFYGDMVFEVVGFVNDDTRSNHAANFRHDFDKFKKLCSKKYSKVYSNVVYESLPDSEYKFIDSLSMLLSVEIVYSQVGEQVVSSLLNE